MRLSLFDLHCDTVYEMLRTGQSLTANTLAVSLDHARAFDAYTQVMAHWTDHSLDDETGWTQFLAMRKHLEADAAIQSGAARIVADASDATSPSARLLLSVEDARILAGRIDRVDALYAHGVRILTPLWKGLTCIGGSHDTTEGLTAFGKVALDRACSLGMILDISHASEASADGIFEIAERYRRPVIASHSNAFAACPVSRNLRDRQVRRILASDGVIGLNLHTAFLRNGAQASMYDLFPHIDHFLSLGASDALCLGCDMDGCDLPPEIPNLSALPRLAEEMLKRNYPEALIQKIFFQNATNFANQYFYKL